MTGLADRLVREPASLHECDLPGSTRANRPFNLGTVWYCGECDTFWVLERKLPEHQANMPALRNWRWYRLGRLWRFTHRRLVSEARTGRKTTR